MTISVIDEMRRLRDDLAANIPESDAELTTFTSGSAMLDVRIGNRAFAMAYSPERGFGVDELAENEGFDTAYRYTFAGFAAAARTMQSLIGLRQGMIKPLSMNLVVLYVQNVEASRDFYSLLGISFAREQHGSGPTHYASTIGPLVFEIYPCRDGQATPSARVGFHVPLLDGTIAMLRSRGSTIVSDVKATAAGYRAVVEDPDGNRVELLSAQTLLNATELEIGTATIPAAQCQRVGFDFVVNE